MAGVADSSGYGWAICKALAEAGATVTVGTWPPVLGIFEKSLKKGSFDEDMKLEDGSKFDIAKVYPLDAVYDVPEDVPEDVKTNKRYAGLSGYTIQEVADQIKADYGQVINNGVHVCPVLWVKGVVVLGTGFEDAVRCVLLACRMGRPGWSVLFCGVQQYLHSWMRKSTCRVGCWCLSRMMF